MKIVMLWQASQQRANKFYACLVSRKAHSPKGILQQIDSDAGRITIEHQNHRPATIEHARQRPQSFFWPLEMMQYTVTHDEIENAPAIRDLVEIEPSNLKIVQMAFVLELVMRRDCRLGNIDTQDVATGIANCTSGRLHGPAPGDEDAQILSRLALRPKQR
jgi:hypothetical protein